MIPATPLIQGSSMLPTESLLTPRPVQKQEMQREAPMGFLTTPAPSQQPRTYSSSAGAVPPQYEKLIQEAAHTSGIPVEYIKGLLFQENKFRTTGRSRTGAKGIAQLTSGFIQDAAKKNNPFFGNPTTVDPWNPESAIKALGAYLRYTNQRYGGDLRKAITAYNAGPWYNGKTKNKEQAEYFDRVHAHAKRYGHKD